MHIELELAFIRASIEGILSVGQCLGGHVDKFLGGALNVH